MGVEEEKVPAVPTARAPPILTTPELENDALRYAADPGDIVRVAMLVYGTLKFVEEPARRVRGAAFEKGELMFSTPLVTARLGAYM